MRAPVVTGISPKEGNPGTKVVIRGENFGVKASDLIGLTICGVNCLMSAEWKSSSKVIARTGQGVENGDVIVKTKSGGQGTCTVQFKAKSFVPGPLEESAIWIDELLPDPGDGISARRSVTQSSAYQDALGIIQTRKKPVDEIIDECYPEGSEDTWNTDFVPAAFLIHKHYDVKFDELKKGLEHLKEEESRRATGPLAFVKENIATFMDAEETLTAVQKEMLKDESGSQGGSLAEALGSYLQGASKHADALFQDVLRRKDDADMMRNALSVLHRFRSLFSLPQIIEKNINQGDYEMVVNDYAKAKSLVSENAPVVFKKVLEEVESKVEKFRNQLRSRLTCLPIPLKEMRRLIKYVIGLDSPGDVAWDCLMNQHKWLLGLLDHCRSDHLEKKSHGSEMRLTISLHLSPGRDSQDAYGGWGTRANIPLQSVPFVEELSEILTESLPDLWKLGNEYLSGSLFNKENIDSEKPTFVPAAEKKDVFHTMVKEITERYSKYIQEVFVGVYKNEPHKETEWRCQREEITPWFPKCVKYVRRCFGTLKTQFGKTSMDPLKSVQLTLEELQFLSIRCLMENAVKEIRNLHTNEDWTKETINNGCVITVLPITFETMTIDILHVLKDVIGDATFGGEKGDEIQKEINELFYKMLQAVIESLDHLGFPSDDELDKISVSSRHHYGSFESKEDINSMSSINSPARDERLLIVLSCCSHLRDSILPKIVSNYQSNGHAGLENLLPSFKTEIMTLEDRIFGAYIELKSGPLVNGVKTGMFAGDFSWSRCGQPSDIRDYVKTVILDLVIIHAQVFSYSSPFVSRVLSRLTEILTEVIYKLFKNAKEKYTTNGVIQAHLELEALREALRNWLTDTSRSCLENSFRCIPALSKDEHQTQVQNLLNTFKEKTKFQLLCFQESVALQA